jgi:hypothetical protein
MRTVVRWVSALVCAAAAVSAGLVLGSNLDPAYRARVDDALWFVVPYLVLQGWMAWELTRDGRAAPWIALGRAVAAYVFLFVALMVPAGGKLWMAWTPGRYVYQLFDWGEGAEILLFGFLFLGRGVGNTLAAVAVTAPWWVEIRRRRPLVGRAVTMLPIVAVGLCGWQFAELFQFAVARDVARTVAAGIDCETVRARMGETTTDIRALGKRRFIVRIEYRCPTTRVMVADEQQRIGAVETGEPCCGGAPVANDAPATAAPD